ISAPKGMMCRRRRPLRRSSRAGSCRRAVSSGGVMTLGLRWREGGGQARGLQQNEGTAGQGISVAGAVRRSVRTGLEGGIGRVYQAVPARAGRLLGQLEIDRTVMRIDEHDERRTLRTRPTEHNAEGAGIGQGPIGWLHLASNRRQPGDVLDADTVDLGAAEE